MLNLFAPEFIVDNITTYINKLANQDAINARIMEELRILFPDPRYVFARVANTGFYSINNLPDQPSYARILNGLRIEGVDITVNGRNYISRLEFNTFDQMEGDRYSDDILRNEDLNVEVQDFSNVRLNNIDLDYKNYIGAIFEHSTLQNSSFQSTYLMNAFFPYADLSGSNFTEADMRFAILMSCDLSNTNLTDANLKYANLRDVVLDGAILTGAILKYAHLRRADLRGADLTGADLRYADLTDTDFTGCILNDTLFYGSNWEESRYDHEEMRNAIVDPQEDDIIDSQADNVMIIVEDILAQEADVTFAEQSEPGSDSISLPPIVIDPTSTIGRSPITYEELVRLLVPPKGEKIPLSKMKINTMYGIESLGNTPLAVWRQVGLIDTEPVKNAVFKCVSVPAETEGEAIVYEKPYACMVVHALSKHLDVKKIFKLFNDTVGRSEIDNMFDSRGYDSMSPKDKLNSIAKEFYIFLLTLLGKHNSDEGDEADTRIFDDLTIRKKLVKHAVFNKDEGIMNHPRFDDSLDGSYADDLMVIQMFIALLPEQVQVAWAQNYITEFINGYGQTTATFDPLIKPTGFAASCVNGNLEKIILSIAPAITHFYKFEPPPAETEAEELQTLIYAITEGSYFQKYFASVEEEEGPTIEGYKTYIDTDLELNPERKERILALLQRPDIIDKINATISLMSGGRKIYRRKIKLTRKNKKIIKITKKRVFKNRISKKRVSKKCVKTISNNKRNNKKKTINKRNNKKL